MAPPMARRNGPRARRPRDRHGPQRRFRRRRQSRHTGGRPSVGRDPKLRCGTGARLSGKARSPPAPRSPPAKSSARPGSLDGTFDLTCRGATTWRCGAGQPDAPPFDQPRDIASPPWTAVLYRADVFRQVGLLEESFESYLEDVDFGLRCTAQRITGRYVPDARAVHVGSAALGRWHPDTVRRMARNQVLLTARHYSARNLWPVLVAQFLWGAVAIRHGRGLAWARGKWQGLQQLLRRPRPTSPGRCQDYWNRPCAPMNNLCALLRRIRIGSCISCSPVGQSDT